MNKEKIHIVNTILRWREPKASIELKKFLAKLKGGLAASSLLIIEVIKKV